MGISVVVIGKKLLQLKHLSLLSFSHVKEIECHVNAIKKPGTFKKLLKSKFYFFINKYFCIYLDMM